jgi:hypothetical protein
MLINTDERECDEENADGGMLMKENTDERILMNTDENTDEKRILMKY